MLPRATDIVDIGSGSGSEVGADVVDVGQRRQDHLIQGVEQASQLLWSIHVRLRYQSSESDDPRTQ